MMPATLPDDAARQRKELVDWFMRRNGPSWMAADEHAFQDWIGTPGNRDAYAQWQADWELMDAMPQESADRLRALVAADRKAEQMAPRPRPANHSPERRRTLVSGLTMAAVAGMTVTGGWLGWRHVQSQPVYKQAFSTRKGQQSEATLPDGSTLRLDTATSLNVTFFRNRREVQLTEGQAVFSETSDAQRPFRVMAGDVQITVVGTKFSVRLTPGVPGREGVEVSVEEGRVRVVCAKSTQEFEGAAPSQAFELAAGQNLVFRTDGLPPELSTAPAGAFATWRSSQLSFSDVPLKEALAEMDRYADLGIASIEPAAASLHLTGTFDPRDAAAVRRVLGNALPVKLERGPNGLEVRLLR
jgi:transmembrane sensor